MASKIASPIPTIAELFAVIKSNTYRGIFAEVFDASGGGNRTLGRTSNHAGLKRHAGGKLSFQLGLLLHDWLRLKLCSRTFRQHVGRRRAGRLAKIIMRPEGQRAQAEHFPQQGFDVGRVKIAVLDLDELFAGEWIFHGSSVAVEARHGPPAPPRYACCMTLPEHRHNTALAAAIDQMLAEPWDKRVAARFLLEHGAGLALICRVLAEPARRRRQVADTALAEDAVARRLPPPPAPSHAA